MYNTDMEDTIGNCISQFNTAAKLPADMVDVEKELRRIVTTCADEIRQLVLDKIGPNEPLDCDCGSESCTDYWGPFKANCVREELRNRLITV